MDVPILWPDMATPVGSGNFEKTVTKTDNFSTLHYLIRHLRGRQQSTPTEDPGILRKWFQTDA